MLHQLLSNEDFESTSDEPVFVMSPAAWSVYRDLGREKAKQLKEKIKTELVSVGKIRPGDYLRILNPAGYM